MEKAELIHLVRGNDWLWEQWWPALLELSPDQATQEVGGSFPSVLATTAHMVGAELAWQARLGGQSPRALPTPSSISQANERWLGLANERIQFLHSTDPKAFVEYKTLDGTAFSNTVEDIYIHVISHAHFHRGQLASQFRLLGLKPPSAHYIGFFRL